VSEVALERSPDESEKGTVMFAKALQAEGGISRVFEPITIDWSASMMGKTFIQL
jgi:hypothetical protein